MLKQYCTERQLEILNAVESEGSMRKAAIKLGISKTAVNSAMAAVKQKAALQGYSPDHDLQHPVPDGFKLKGASTLYDAKTGEAKIQWIKSEVDKERQDIIFKEIVAALSATIPKAEPIPAPQAANDDLAVCYPVGDPHIGMLSWHFETGDDYDLSISEKLFAGAIDHLVSVAPPCNTALIAFLGDLFHYDSTEAVTPTHRHNVDSDSRFPKMIDVVTRTVRYMITRVLEKHGRVHVIVELGNHDPYSAVFLAKCLSMLYENEPRIVIDPSPSHFHYWRFGKNLIGVNHGDKVKMANLPLIMATDRAADWGETEYRAWYTGHIHHDRLVEFPGCTVESFGILPGLEAYAHSAGYRASKNMKAIVLHKESGPAARYIFNPKMLKKKDAN